MKTILSLALGLGVICFCGEAFAQCSHSGGQRGGGQGFSRSSFSQNQGGSQNARLLTQQGSYFHDLVMQNYRQQQFQRQQAAIAAAKQAKKDERRGKQLDTRRAQREEELARRAAKKRAAASQLDLYSSN